MDKKILVLGVGNVLMGDDAFGPQVIATLEKILPEHIRKNVQLLESPTPTMGLLSSMEGLDALIVVDAAEFGGIPGAYRRVLRSQIASKTSPAEVFHLHSWDLISIVDSACHLGLMQPSAIIFYCVQFGKIEMSTEMTPEVQAAILPVAQQMINEIAGFVSLSSQNLHKGQ